MYFPSRDQSVPQPLGVPILMSNSSWPVPVAALMYKSNAPFRLEGHRTRNPSEDQIGRLSTAGSKVILEGTPRIKSNAQMSTLEASVRLKTIRFSSGDNRKPAYSPGGPADSICFPDPSIDL